MMPVLGKRGPVKRWRRLTTVDERRRQMGSDAAVPIPSTLPQIKCSASLLAWRKLSQMAKSMRPCWSPIAAPHGPSDGHRL